MSLLTQPEVREAFGFADGGAHPLRVNARDELLDRAAQLGPALRQMAEDLAVARRENANLRRENAALRRRTEESQVRSYMRAV